MLRYSRLAGLALAALPIATAADASLSTFKEYVGNVDLSTDGWGALGSSTAGAVGTISAGAPAGSTVVAAYLYTATQRRTAEPTTVVFDGTPIDYTRSVENTSTTFELTSHRADVTSIVAPRINGSAATSFDFTIDEGADGILSGGKDSIDGHALVVVYDNPALPTQTVALLDGFASVTGDTATVSFGEPIDASDPGLLAEMYLGINFSCCSQKSTVEVNGSLLTENAGNFDDGASADDGSLITVGSFDDPFSPALPGYADDREKYDLAPFLSSGDTGLSIVTSNGTRDDNIFLAGFVFSGEADISTPDDPDEPGVVPLPASALLLGGGLAALGLRRKRRKAD